MAVQPLTLIWLHSSTAVSEFCRLPQHDIFHPSLRWPYEALNVHHLGCSSGDVALKPALIVTRRLHDSEVAGVKTRSVKCIRLGFSV